MRFIALARVWICCRTKVRERPTNQTFPQNQLTEYGPSDFDVRHNLIISGLYEFQYFKGRDNWTKALDGFTINGIIQWHSGLPWTPFSGNCVSTPGGQTLCPTLPLTYNGLALTDGSNDAFIRAGGNFPGGGLKVLHAWIVSASGKPTARSRTQFVPWPAIFRDRPQCWQTNGVAEVHARGIDPGVTRKYLQRV